MKKKIFLYPDSYQTGDTQPPKKKQWLTLFVLAGLILVSSVLIGFSFLFPQVFASPAPRTLAYAKAAEENGSESGKIYGVDVVKYEALGISGQVVPPFFRMYYDMPTGIYITALDEKNAHLSPLLPGDILISCQGNNVTTHYQLTRILQSLWDAEQSCWTVDTAVVEVYRNDRIHQLYVSLE